MLEELDGSLRNFLRAGVPLRADDIDIEFATPDKEWSSRLSRSTVNLFLYDVRRSTTRAVSGRSVRQTERGYSSAFRAPLIRTRYLITVWTAESTDEHRVLGDILRLLAVTGSLPSEHLVGDLAGLDDPVELGLGGDDGMRPNEMWSPLGVAPRANIELVVTLPARRPLEQPVAFPPREVHATVVDPPDLTREPRLVSRRRRALVEEQPRDTTSKSATGTASKGTS